MHYFFQISTSLGCVFEMGQQFKKKGKVEVKMVRTGGWADNPSDFVRHRWKPD